MTTYRVILEDVTEKRPISVEDLTLIAQLRELHSWDGEEKLSHAEWLEKRKLQVSGVGRVLQFLGLAEPDERSCLGWKARQRFFQIAKKTKGQNYRVFEGLRTENDAIIVDMLRGLAIGVVTNDLDKAADVYIREQSSVFMYAVCVLSGLDLYFEDEDEEAMPSPLLRELFLQRAVKTI
jgi:hypothetical protein